MQVGRSAAYGGYVEATGGMTDLHKHVVSFNSNSDSSISISEMHNGELLVYSPF
jgi:hypothetical protein